MGYSLISNTKWTLTGGGAQQQDQVISYEAGDLLVAQTVRRNLAGIGTISDQSGILTFVLIGQTLNSANNSCQALYAIAPSTGSSTIRWLANGGASGNQTLISTISVFRGMDVSGDPIHTAYAQPTAGTQDPIPLVGRTVSNNGLDCLWFAYGSANALVMGSGFGVLTTNGFTQLFRNNDDTAASFDTSSSCGIIVVPPNTLAPDATCDLSASTLSISMTFGLKIATVPRVMDLSGIVDTSF